MSRNVSHDGVKAGCWLMVLCFMATACTPVQRLPERTMGVSAGPDRVFAQPVEQLIPRLSGATATGNNGRVGNELVFWEYRLSDSTTANFFACADLPDVNCEARLDRICPGTGQELARAVHPGTIRQLNCRLVGVAGVGDLRPGCQDISQSSDLLVGLMQCR